MLEQINTMLVDAMGPLGPVVALGILGLFLVLGTLPILMNRKEDPLDKLKKSNLQQISDPKMALRAAQGNDKLEKFSGFLEPQDEEEYSAMRLKLLQAGYPGKEAVRTFHFAQFALGLGFLVLGVGYVFLQKTTGAEVTTQKMMLSVLIPGGAGYYLPKYWVTRRVEERKEQITNGFPDALDMMLVCVEAGQSLDQSIIRVAREIRAGYPALADEFEIVAHEMKAGKDRIQVLRDMAERAGVPDVASFVTVLIQSTSFGTSIAEALRVYAGEMRDKRVMRAEEKANTLPTKMTLATMMLTVPPLLIILIGPSVYEIYVTLQNANF
ncbi:type II secretion system F family protein [Aliiroseovarius sp.]|uniref:type II secretion system F family protein n=1 Tax=Aliiroseovarius sp. TaxID=1872442 RepID=UPI0026317A41|nr:type II secretion system F family protein [Aliiroseovarius sp.]